MYIWPGISGATIIANMKLGFSAALNLPCSGRWKRGESEDSKIRESQRMSSGAGVRGAITGYGWRAARKT